MSIGSRHASGREEATSDKSHEQGAQKFVRHAWCELEKLVTCEDFPKTMPAFLGLLPIVREAAERPELRQLRPFISLFSYASVVPPDIHSRETVRVQSLSGMICTA